MGAVHPLVACLIVASTAVSSTAVADTIHVPADQPTIQAGIGAALNGDEVVVAPGSYHEAIDFLGKAITVRSSAGPDATTIDGAGLDTSVVRFVNGETPDSVLRGFRILDGEGSADGADRIGGGLLVVGASPRLIECIFQDNIASADETAHGGAVFVDDGSPSFRGCTFVGNRACGDDAVGGAIAHTGGLLALRECDFIDNASVGHCFSAGGGALRGSGPMVVVNCRFVANGAHGSCCAGFAAGDGGAIYASAGLTLVNSSLSDNSATGCDADTGFGGGVYATGPSVAIVGCTFYANGAQSCASSAAFIEVGTVTNCIVWAHFCDDPLAGGAAVSYSLVEGGHPGPGNIPTDPLFVDELNGNFQLAPGSPAIDRGDSAAVPADALDLDDDGDTIEQIPIDLGGNPRRLDEPCTPDRGRGEAPIVDLGAHEASFSGAGVDCNDNGVPDCDDVAGCAAADCNGNAVPDECDIADGTSEDCSGNGIPDECEPDCNGNGVPDSCDIVEGVSEDCSGNGIPDECEPDCNANGLPDSCDIVEGVAEDLDGNEVPDECDGAWRQVLRVSGATGPASFFGHAVAIGDDFMVVGDSLDPAAGNNTGAIYCYDAHGGCLLHKLHADDAAAESDFGVSVAIDGPIAIVGANWEDGLATDSGAAYVFDVATGEQLHKLKASDADAGDQFGGAVAISGGLAIVGAHRVGSSSGAAYIFDVTTGEELRKITPIDAPAGAQFGRAVSIFGTTALVGNGLVDGAYLFDATTGVQLDAYLGDPDSDEFGASVALSEHFAIVGDWGDDDDAPNGGAVYVFAVETGERLHKLTAGDAANFQYRLGRRLTVWDDVILAGAGQDDGPAENAGAAYLFDARTGEVIQVLRSDEPVETGLFGTSVSIRGNAAFIGAGGDFQESAYLFVTCPADVSGDLVVGVDDLILIILHWGERGGLADVDGDGVVGTGDLVEIVLRWGPCY